MSGRPSESGFVDLNLFDPLPKEDMWRILLRLVAPHDTAVEDLGSRDIVPSAIGIWSPVISDVMVVMSSIAIILAALWIVWQTIYAVQNAAWSGRAIADEWNSIWGPLRIVLGIGLMVPLVNGANLAQIAVLQVASFSGKVGNVIYDQAKPVIHRNLTVSSTSPLQDIIAVSTVRPMVRQELCMRAWAMAQADRFNENFAFGRDPLIRVRTNAATESGFWSDARRMTETAFVATSVPDARTLAQMTGRSPNNFIRETHDCDAFGLHASFNTSLIASASQANESSNSFMQNIMTIWDRMAGRTEREVPSATFSRAAHQTAKAYADVLQQISRDFAAQFAWRLAESQRGTMAVSENVDTSNIRDEYIKWEESAVKLVVDVFNQNSAMWQESLKEHIKGSQNDLDKAGWLTIPSVLMQIHLGSTSMKRAEATLPTWVAEQSDEMMRTVTSFLNQTSQSNRAVAQTMARLESPLRDIFNTPGMVRLEPGVALSGDPTFNALYSLGLFPTVDLRKGSAIGQLRDWGNNLMLIGSMLWAGANILSIPAGIVKEVSDGVSSERNQPGNTTQSSSGRFSKIVSSLNVIGRILGGLGALGALVGGIMVFVGVLHAYVLPMLPSILFITFAIGNLILVVEAFLAAPLWALAHVNAAGRGFVDQRQSLGYQIIFALFLRIPIAVSAFIFSLITTDIGVYAVQWMFSYSWNAITGDSAGMFGYVAALLIFCYLTWTIALRSYSMITELPDRVIRWMGLQPISPESDQSMRGAVGIAVMGLQRAGSAAGIVTSTLGRAAPSSPPLRVVGTTPPGGGLPGNGSPPTGLPSPSGPMRPSGGNGPSVSKLRNGQIMRSKQSDL